MRIYGTKSTKTYYNLLQQFYEGEEGNQKYPEPFGPEANGSRDRPSWQPRVRHDIFLEFLKLAESRVNQTAFKQLIML